MYLFTNINIIINTIINSLTNLINYKTIDKNNSEDGFEYLDKIV
jgi:hypothetical protein